jgi:hypothetical protein
MKLFVRNDGDSLLIGNVEVQVVISLEGRCLLKVVDQRMSGVPVDRKEVRQERLRLDRLSNRNNALGKRPKLKVTG